MKPCAHTPELFALIFMSFQTSKLPDKPTLEVTAAFPSYGAETETEKKHSAFYHPLADTEGFHHTHFLLTVLFILNMLFSEVSFVLDVIIIPSNRHSVLAEEGIHTARNKDLSQSTV